MSKTLEPGDTVAIDFDGTIVGHCYPEIGPLVPGAIETMLEMQAAGYKLILWTMRSDDSTDGAVLTAAVNFCKSYGIEFWGVNNNPKQKEWTSSPKAYARAYIDDAALGCPLRDHPSARVTRPCVDWLRIRKFLNLGEK